MPNLVTKGSAVQKISGQIVVKIWTFTMTLTLKLNRAIQYFTRQSGFWCSTIKPSKYFFLFFWISNSEDSQKSHFDHIRPCCGLDLEDNNPLFSPAGHTDWWCCNNIQSLVKEGWAVLKISGQNLHTHRNREMDTDDYSNIRILTLLWWVNKMYFTVNVLTL